MTETFEKLTTLLTEKRPATITSKDLAMLFHVDYNENIQSEVERIEIGDGRILFQYLEGTTIQLYLTQDNGDWYVSDTTDYKRKTQIDWLAGETEKGAAIDNLFVEVIKQKGVTLTHDLTFWIEQAKFSNGIMSKSVRRVISDIDFISKLLHAQKNSLDKLQIFEDIYLNF